MSAQTFRELFDEMLRESPDICYESERCVAIAGAVAALEIAAQHAERPANYCQDCGGGLTEDELRRLASELGGERRG